MGVRFQWLGGPLGYFTDGTLKKEFFPEDSFEEQVFNGLNAFNHAKGLLPSIKGSSVIQIHVSGVKSTRYIAEHPDRDRFFNLSREKTGNDVMNSLCHHLTKLEPLGRNLFFALRRSDIDCITIGLILLPLKGDCPVIIFPNDQQAVRQALFGHAETWVPDMIPFLGQLITSAHPLLLKAHNETGFMPRFTEITGAPNFKSGLFYLREKMLNMEYDNKEKLYLSVTQFFRAMKRYFEEMEKEGGVYLANPLPKAVLQSALAGLKMVDDHRKGGDGNSSGRFKIIDVFTYLSGRNSVTDTAANQEIDGGDIEEGFEVLELPANSDVLAENEPQSPAGSNPPGGAIDPNKPPEPESEIKPPTSPQRQDQSVRPKDQQMRPGVGPSGASSSARYETLLDWMRGAFPNHPVAALRRIAATYHNESRAVITEVLQRMVDEEEFSASEEDFPIARSITAHEDDVDAQVTTDGGDFDSTPRPCYQVFSRGISDVYDPDDQADINTR